MATTHIESKIGVVKSSAEAIFNFLSDFNNIGKFIPPGQVKDWESDTDSCSFVVDKIGKVGIRVVERQPNSTIKLSGDQAPVEFFFWIQIKEVAPYDSRIKLTIKAELNIMLKAIAEKPLQKFVDQLTDQLAIIPYHQM